MALLSLNGFDFGKVHTAPSADNPYAWDFADPRTRQIPPVGYDELGLFSALIRVGYHISAVVGGVMSLVLFYLVVFKSSGPLKPYSRMLLLCSITDMIYWITDLFVQLKSRIADGVFMVQVEGLARGLSYENQAFFIAVYVTALTLVQTVLPAQHYFRYYALTRMKPLTVCKTIFLYLAAVLIALPMGFIAYPSYYKSALERPGFNYATLWYRQVPTPPVFYADIRSNYQRCYFIYASSVVGFCYAIALWIVYKTVKYMNKHAANYSHKTKEMQAQLSHALFFQTLLPVFVSVIPILGVCLPSLFFWDTGSCAAAFVLIMSLVPIFNPLLTILAIVPYRRAVAGLLMRKKVVEDSSVCDSHHGKRSAHTEVLSVLA